MPFKKEPRFSRLGLAERSIAFNKTCSRRRSPSLSCGGVRGLRSAAWTPFSCCSRFSLLCAISSSLFSPLAFWACTCVEASPFDRITRTAYSERSELPHRKRSEIAAFRKTDNYHFRLELPKLSLYHSQFASSAILEERAISTRSIGTGTVRIFGDKPKQGQNSWRKNKKGGILRRRKLGQNRRKPRVSHAQPRQNAGAFQLSTRTIRRARMQPQLTTCAPVRCNTPFRHLP